MDESGINKSWYEWCFFVVSCCLLGWLLEYFDIEELCEATTDCEDRLSKELVHLFLGNVRNSWTKYPTHVAGLFFHLYIGYINQIRTHSWAELHTWQFDRFSPCFVYLFLQALPAVPRHSWDGRTGE